MFCLGVSLKSQTLLTPHKPTVKRVDFKHLYVGSESKLKTSTTTCDICKHFITTEE